MGNSYQLSSELLTQHGYAPTEYIMKTKAFEPGAICAAVALLFLLSLSAYAKSGGSSAVQTMGVGETSSNATSIKPVTSSGKTQSGTLKPVTSSRKTQSGASQNIQVKSDLKKLNLKQTASRSRTTSLRRRHKRRMSSGRA